VTSPEIIDLIYEIILEDRLPDFGKINIWATGHLTWAGRFIIHGDFDMQKLSAKWVPKCVKADQKRTSIVPVVRATFGNFLFDAIQIISCRDWWPWTKPACITITWRRTSNQWSGGIAANPAPVTKNSELKNPLEKFSPASIFFKKPRRHPPHCLFSQAPNYQLGILWPIHTYHAVPLPYRSAKVLVCFIPICFTQCGRVWFTHTTPFPCHAKNVSFWKRSLKAKAGSRQGNGMCELVLSVQRRHEGDLPAFGFFRLPRGVPGSLSEAYQSQMQVASVKQSNVYHGRGEAYYFGARTWVLV
jgi:hypothetical protein